MKKKSEARPSWWLLTASCKSTQLLNLCNPSWFSASGVAN